LSGAGVATFVNKSFPVIRQWHRNQHVDRRGFRIADGRSVRSHDRSVARVLDAATHGRSAWQLNLP